MDGDTGGGGAVGGGAAVSSVASALVRGVRGAVEMGVGAALAFVYAGRGTAVDPLGDEILMMPAHVLARKIRDGEVSSEAAVRACAARVAQTEARINAVVEDRFADALLEARLADERVRAGRVDAAREPLLGVPFTAKEAVLVAGLSSTCGLVCRQGLKAAHDSEAVAALRSQGAIPIAVTNTSEICMWWETYNKLHGRTNNPYDDSRTVGGSSGGEAALIAAGGSLIGLGTDLGGSIRLPAFFTGIFGHKPSQGLVPSGGQYPPALSGVSPYVSTGPMARYAADLRLVLKSLITEQDAQQIRLGEKVDLKSVTVFYMLDDGGHPAQTPVTSDVRDAVEKAIQSLTARGLTVHKVQLRHIKHGFMIWCSHLAMVKDQRISRLMTGDVDGKVEGADPLHWELWRWLSGRSNHTLPIILNACAQDHGVPLVTSALNYYLRRGEELKIEVDEMFKSMGGGDSVFLYPTFPTPAPHHGQLLATPTNVGYCVAFNSLGLPVTQCPLGMGAASRMPVGVQIVTTHRNDRVAIAVAEALEEDFGGWVPPS